MDLLKGRCSIKRLFFICFALGAIVCLFSLCDNGGDLVKNLADKTVSTKLNSLDSYVRETYVKPELPNCTREANAEEDSMNVRGRKNLRKRFPTAIIIGVKKGGTRALLTMLELHPTIVTAHPEIHYFDYDANFRRGVEFYIDQMPVSSPQQVTLEKSPHYFVADNVPERMSMVSPNLKLILIVRDPVTRLISDYTQLSTKKITNNKELKLLEDVVLLRNGSINSNYVPVQVSKYNEHFKRWLKYFLLDQILVLNGDSFIMDPVSELKRVEAFLQIKPFFKESQFVFNETKGFYCWKSDDSWNQDTQQCLGDKKGRKHPEIRNDILQKLKQYFKPNNNEFFQLAHQSFNW